MSHNLGLFMLTHGFCLQPANKNINFQLIMNSQKRIVTVAFKKIFLTKIEDMHTEFKKILYSRVLNLYKKKILSALSNNIIQDIIA